MFPFKTPLTIFSGGSGHVVTENQNSNYQTRQPSLSNLYINGVWHPANHNRHIRDDRTLSIAKSHIFTIPHWLAFFYANTYLYWSFCNAESSNLQRKFRLPVDTRYKRTWWCDFLTLKPTPTRSLTHMPKCWVCICVRANNTFHKCSQQKSTVSMQNCWRWPNRLREGNQTSTVCTEFHTFAGIRIRIRYPSLVRTSHDKVRFIQRHVSTVQVMTIIAFVHNPRICSCGSVVKEVAWKWHGRRITAVLFWRWRYHIFVFTTKCNIRLLTDAFDFPGLPRPQSVRSTLTSIKYISGAGQRRKLIAIIAKIDDALPNGKFFEFLYIRVKTIYYILRLWAGDGCK